MIVVTKQGLLRSWLWQTQNKKIAEKPEKPRNLVETVETMGRPIALGSTIAHAYNKLRSVKVEIPQNNFVVSVKAVPQVLSSCACTFQHFYVS